MPGATDSIVRFVTEVEVFPGEWRRVGAYYATRAEVEVFLPFNQHSWPQRAVQISRVVFDSRGGNYIEQKRPDPAPFDLGGES